MTGLGRGFAHCLSAIHPKKPGPPFLPMQDSALTQRLTWTYTMRHYQNPGKDDWEFAVLVCDESALSHGEGHTERSSGQPRIELISEIKDGKDGVHKVVSDLSIGRKTVSRTVDGVGRNRLICATNETQIDWQKCPVLRVCAQFAWHALEHALLSFG